MSRVLYILQLAISFIWSSILGKVYASKFKTVDSLRVVNCHAFSMAFILNNEYLSSPSSLRRFIDAGLEKFYFLDDKLFVFKAKLPRFGCYRFAVLVNHPEDMWGIDFRG